jgi:hypothetical protein
MLTVYLTRTLRAAASLVLNFAFGTSETITNLPPAILVLPDPFLVTKAPMSSEVP